VSFNDIFLTYSRLLLLLLKRGVQQHDPFVWSLSEECVFYKFGANHSIEQTLFKSWTSINT
jgi:hypothetical protein